jgi:hypothetical protein
MPCRLFRPLQSEDSKTAAAQYVGLYGTTLPSPINDKVPD